MIIRLQFIAAAIDKDDYQFILYYRERCYCSSSQAEITKGSRDKGKFSKGKEIEGRAEIIYDFYISSPAG